MDHQGAQVLKLVKIFQSNIIAGTSSKPGYGKTYEALSLACLFDLPVLWIGHPTTAQFVTNRCAEYNVKLIQFLSYQMLAGTSLKVNHVYLKRKSSDNTKFRVTHDFKKLVKKGVLVVLDEVQFVGKTDSCRYNAAYALTQHLVKTRLRKKRCPSRCLLASGTFFDLIDYNNVLATSHLLGFSELPSKKKYQKGFDKHSNKLIEYHCKKMDPSNPIIEESNDSLTKESVVTLFKEIVMKHMIPAADPPVLTCAKIVDVLMIGIKTNEMAALSKAYKHLCISTSFNRVDKTVLLVGKRGDSSIIQSSICRDKDEVQMCLLPAIVRLVRHKMESCNDRKFVIILSSDYAVDAVASKLKIFDPLLISTRVKSVKTRQRIIDTFQADDFTSEDRRRLLIGTIGTVGIGSSLDDTIGNQPREVFLLPSVDLQQAEWRTFRATTKSNTWVHYVYPRQLPQMIDLFDAITRKTIGGKTTTRVLPAALSADYQFPLSHVRVEGETFPDEDEVMTDDQILSLFRETPLKRAAAVLSSSLTHDQLNKSKKIKT